MTPVELVISKVTTATGRDPKRGPSGWTSRCPAHDDSSPSLSINEGRDGNALLKCHAGCSLDDIVAAIGLEVTDLFPPKEKSGGLGEVTARYVYEDADGKPVLRVLRFHPKTFRQQHWDGRTWINGAKGVGPILYRLPAVRAEAEVGGTVWIAEGEKDVHALEAAGLVATCNAAGAGKFTTGHAAQLAGIGLAVIVADNDSAGHAHAAAVASELDLADIAYKIVLPASGKDAFDHLNAGHGVDEFVPVVNLKIDDTTEPDPWPDPIPLGAFARELPTFPTDALPDWIADHAHAVADELQMPVDLPAILSLTTLAALTAGGAVVNVQNRWTEQLNIYAAVAMPPSAGKSPAFSRMTGPITEHQERLARKADTAIPIYEQEKRVLEKRMSKAEASGDMEDARAALYELMELKPVISPRLIADDATPEALTQLLADHGGRMAIMSTEGGLFDLMTGRYSDKANLDVYLKAWGGDTITVDRIGRGPAHIKHPALTIGLTVQPSVIAALADKPELAGRGLTARFMYSMPIDNVGQRNFLTERPTDQAAADTYDRRMAEIAEARTDHVTTMTLDGDARKMFSRWKQQLENQRGINGPLRPLSEWSTKLESTTVRVAGLLHLADGHSADGVIDAATMARAVKIGDYWLAHAHAVHDLWGADPILMKARRILDWATGRESFTVRDLYSDNRRIFPRADDTIDPLNLLVERGWLRPETDDWPPRLGQRGKPTPTLTVHPTRGAAHAAHAVETSVQNDPKKGEVARHAAHALRDINESTYLLSEKTRTETQTRAHGAHGPHLAPTGTDPSPLNEDGYLL